MKKVLAMLLVATLVLSCAVFPTTAFAAENDMFYDDFSADSLNTDKWLVAEKSWGGFNGGVVPENVSVSDGTLKLEGHGNYYTGDVKGLNRQLPNGVRTGAAIATRDYFGSGSYEVVAKVAPVFGACSAMWTFEYEEYYPSDDVYEAAGATGTYYDVNHEIDIEIPGRHSSNAAPDFNYALCNTFVRENKVMTNFTKLPYAIDDNQFHTYRFDWHTGDDGEMPRVEYFIDGQQICVCTTHIPTNAGRFWLGIWFPCSVDSDKDGYCDTGWTGTANFDTAVFEIDSVRITPFHEAGDTPQNESFGKDGWAADSFPEDIEAEHYNHIFNGDFSHGETAWDMSGDAAVVDGAACLTSGATTDTIDQIVSVQPKMTYTLTADVTTDGTDVTVGVRKLNGMDNACKTVNTSGPVTITFTTGAAVNEMDVYAQVLRYQSVKSPVKIDNITLVSGGVPTGPVGPVAPVDPVDPVDPVVRENLIVNGAFDNGEDGWDLSGSAAVTNGAAKLASGSDTDTIDQTVQVKKGSTYTLSADIKSDGAEVIFGVKDYNGRYTELSNTYSADGQAAITFTTADHIGQIEVFAKVLRYQGNTSPVTVDNICLHEGTDVPVPVDPVDPVDPIDPVDPEPVVNNLLINGDLSDGGKGWKLTGSARVADGKAYLDSGKDTDTMDQKIDLEANTTYVLKADLISHGCIVDLKASGFDGKYSSTSVSYSQNASGELIFTTGKHAKDIKITIQVLRYQNTSDVVSVDNISLTPVNG